MSFLGHNVLQTPDYSRREFIKLAGASGSLLVGLTTIPSLTTAKNSKNDGNVLNAYVQIDPDGVIKIFAPNPEVGQGVKTSLPMIVAEELDAHWDQVVVENAPVDDQIYGNQFAGGSRSIPMRWDELRGVGAVARNMLMQAAASSWKVPVHELSTAKSTVTHKKSGRSVSYGELSKDAVNMSVPKLEKLVFKTPDQYQLLGQRITGVDNDAIVTGKPIFGIDTVVDDMLYACYIKCPQIGGKAVSANLDEIKALPGIRHAFLLEGTIGVTYFSPAGDAVASGVAIVADSTWQAIKARKALKVKWDTSSASTDNWDEYVKQAAELSKAPGATVLDSKGNVDKAFKKADKTVQSNYSYAFVSHAQLEPQNCVAYCQDDSIEAWAPTQTPNAAVESLTKLLGFPKEKVTVHQIRGGGGFGRRLDNEYVREAALISREVGAPVKLQWTREDDMAFDYFRAGGFYSIRGGVDKKGRLSVWDNHSITVSADGEKANTSANHRPTDFPGKMLEHYRITQSLLDSKTPTGPWRAPVSNVYAFVEQSFVHELAIAAQRDHLEFLVEAMGKPMWFEKGNMRSLNTSRAVDVIKTVGERAGWGRSMPDGRALGLSFYFSHAGHIAEIADVSVDAAKKLTIHKVWVVADVGPIVNLSSAENQAQGSIIDGISTMLAQQITMKDGQIEQSNYHQYPLLRANQRTEIDIHFVESDYSPTGMGEPALPPLAAAVTNAIFGATGDRIRNLPLSNSGYTI